MTAKKSDARKLLKILSSVRSAHRRSEQRKSVNTLKHESESLGHQPHQPRRSRAATLPTNLEEEREEVEGVVPLVVVEETVSQDRVMSSRLQEARHRLASCSIPHIPLNQVVSLSRRKKRVPADLVPQVHRRSRSVSLKGLQEVVVEALCREADMEYKLGRLHERCGRIHEDATARLERDSTGPVTTKVIYCFTKEEVRRR